MPFEIVEEDHKRRLEKCKEFFKIFRFTGHPTKSNLTPKQPSNLILTTPISYENIIENDDDKQWVTDVIAYLYDFWSAIRMECARQLKDHFSSIPIHLRVELSHQLIQSLSNRDPSRPWQELHGTLEGLKICLPLLSSEDMDTVAESGLTLMGHISIPLREVASDTLSRLFPLQKDKKEYINRILSRIHTMISDSYRYQEEDVTLALDGHLSCLSSIFSIAHRSTISSSSSSHPSYHHHHQHDDDDSQYYTDWDNLSIIVKKCFNHPASSVRQKAGQIISVLLIQLAEEVAVKPFQHMLEKVLMATIESHGLDELEEYWCAIEVCLIVSEEVIRSLAENYLTQLAMTFPQTQDRLLHYSLILQLVYLLQSRLICYLGHSRFEVRRVVIQLLPTLARCLLLFGHLAKDHSLLLQYVTVADEEVVVEEEEEDRHSDEGDAYDRHIYSTHEGREKSQEHHRHHHHHHTTTTTSSSSSRPLASEGLNVKIEQRKYEKVQQKLMLSAKMAWAAVLIKENRHLLEALHASGLLPAIFSNTEQWSLEMQGRLQEVHLRQAFHDQLVTALQQSPSLDDMEDDNDIDNDDKEIDKTRSNSSIVLSTSFDILCQALQHNDDHLIGLLEDILHAFVQRTVQDNNNNSNNINSHEHEENEHHNTNSTNNDKEEEEEDDHIFLSTDFVEFVSLTRCYLYSLSIRTPWVISNAYLPPEHWQDLLNKCQHLQHLLDTTMSSLWLQYLAVIRFSNAHYGVLANISPKHGSGSSGNIGGSSSCLDNDIPMKRSRSFQLLNSNIGMSAIEYLMLSLLAGQSYLHVNNIHHHNHHHHPHHHHHHHHLLLHYQQQHSRHRQFNMTTTTTGSNSSKVANKQQNNNNNNSCSKQQQQRQKSQQQQQKQSLFQDDDDGDDENDGGGRSQSNKSHFITGNSGDKSQHQNQHQHPIFSIQWYPGYDSCEREVGTCSTVYIPGVMLLPTLMDPSTHPSLHIRAAFELDRNYTSHCFEKEKSAEVVTSSSLRSFSDEREAAVVINMNDLITYNKTLQTPQSSSKLSETSHSRKKTTIPAALHSPQRLLLSTLHSPMQKGQEMVSYGLTFSSRNAYAAMDRWHCEAISPLLFTIAHDVNHLEQAVWLLSMVIDWILSCSMDALWLDGRHFAFKKLMEACHSLLIFVQNKIPAAPTHIVMEARVVAIYWTRTLIEVLKRKMDSLSGIETSIKTLTPIVRSLLIAQTIASDLHPDLFIHCINSYGDQVQSQGVNVIFSPQSWLQETVDGLDKACHSLMALVDDMKTEQQQQQQQRSNSTSEKVSTSMVELKIECEEKDEALEAAVDEFSDWDEEESAASSASDAVLHATDSVNLASAVSTYSLSNALVGNWSTAKRYSKSPSVVADLFFAEVSYLNRLALVWKQRLTDFNHS